ncbi:Threonylcarbamoyl-AMP synthase [Streptomyces violaceorubidus]
MYGIGADAFSAEAVGDLLEAKGRGRNMPSPVLIGSPNTLHGLVTDFSEMAWELVDAFWPGALTLVAKHQPSLQWDLGETRGTVAVRMPLHPVAIELLTDVGPMAVSSANLTGHPAPEDCDAAQQMLGDSVSVYLDGGPTPGIAPRPSSTSPARCPSCCARARCRRRSCARWYPTSRWRIDGPWDGAWHRQRGTRRGDHDHVRRPPARQLPHPPRQHRKRLPLADHRAATRHAVQERLGVLGGGLIVESAGTWGHEGAPMEANAETVLTDFGADPAGFPAGSCSTST